jgi:hypothetical protein
MSNALDQLACWEAEFVFVKTMLGSKNYGRFGLYDNRIIVLSDLGIMEPKDAVFVAGVQLNNAMLAATEKGVYYTSWTEERNIWLSHMDLQYHITSLVKSFDLKWQNIAATFITSPPKPEPKIRSSDLKPIEIAYSDMFDSLKKDRVHLTPTPRVAHPAQSHVCTVPLYLYHRTSTAVPSCLVQ